jgi:hypothetical protein
MSSRSPEVDAWLAKQSETLREPLALIREIILCADDRVEESIKWQTPTFSYKGNIVSFQGNAKRVVSLMFHHGASIPGDHPILEGEGKVSRSIRLEPSVTAVEENRAAISAVIRAWCAAKGGA